ncbi:RICIN domain-containing protein [Mangrovihabitans endophyticus]|uniref:Ricin B lectin domain-containing protein n=1 Tax=Mangrovihabitans endophyticus TaxID=1751298 RepID=A0A8J3C2G3_9ACTN|nr:RICIN domain-containing protein [Mangrovihabitans endophyticus]GGL00425.1 hypothetical protein GCM10012284_38580 [Mangrovihabitans endophyticus]
MLSRSPCGGRARRWRAALITVLSAAVAAVGAVAVAPVASAATVDTSAWYVFVNRNSGKAMDVYNLATADGAGIAQYTRNDGAWQQWQFVPVGSGYYQIRSRHSGKLLELPNAIDGTQLIQNSDNGSTRQHFALRDSADGYVRFVNRHTSKVLDVWEWSTADGAIISQYADLDGYNQQWQMIPVGSATPPAGDCGSGSYQAEAVLSGSTWTARTSGGSVVYTGSDTRAAVQAAIGALPSGRTSKQKVVVRGSGSISAGSRISLPSYTALEWCGTVNVTGSGSGDQAPVYARGAHDIEVTRIAITGSPLYGIFARNVDNIVLGQIDIRVSGGLGVRIDNHGDTSVKSRNVRIDTVYVQGTSTHGVETYGVDGLTVGTVTARDTGGSGLLLNDTTNAEVGTVDGQGAGTGTGYAAFRMANRNGRVGSSYPTNIHVGSVVARGGGRGVFCVSESGGAVIDRVDIAGTGSNSILIENCYNVTIAGQSGTVNGSDVRLAARTEFAPNADITVQNLTLVNSAINENPCNGSNIVIRNITLQNSQINDC